MRILFVNPSLRPEAADRFLPMGLGYVLTAVSEAGFEFDLLDIDSVERVFILDWTRYRHGRSLTLIVERQVVYYGQAATGSHIGEPSAYRHVASRTGHGEL